MSTKAPGAPLPLAVSMGEPAGIGTEVLFKAYSALKQQERAAPLSFYVIDDPARLAALARGMGADFQCLTIEKPADAPAAFTHGLPVIPPRDVDLQPLREVTPGNPSTKTAKIVIASIEQAVQHTLGGAAGGVVTLPIQKAVLNDIGFTFAGHTEFLGALTDNDPMPEGLERGAVMMLAAGNFRTVPMTVHVPLVDVAAHLSQDKIVRKVRAVVQSLRRDFGIEAPRIAIAGLNPHAGEDGHLGTEEKRIITPAAELLRQEGLSVAGPHPADTLFHAEARRHYDAILGMYHDQALVPIKTIAFHEAVNVTLGLPIVRTSPDHGTGLALAGQNRARPDSTIAAILMAAQIAAARRHYDLG